MQTDKVTVVEHLLTIPEAQVRIFDIEWQSAFYEVFHQTKTSRLFHTLCMAPIVFSLFALSSYINISSVSLIPGLDLLTAVNGAFVLMLMLAVWYLIMDLTIGLVSVPILIGFWMLSNVFSYGLGFTGIYVAIGVLIVASLIQTISHQPELVPPPHSGSKEFVPYKEWITNSSLGQRIKVIILFPVFTMVELISSPRLLPVQVLRLMHRFGYKPELKALTEKRAKRVLETGDYNAY